MDIFTVIKHVVEDIEPCGLYVKAICTDNCPMKVNIFKMFSPTHTLEPIVPHILDPNDIKSQNLTNRPLATLWVTYLGEEVSQHINNREMNWK